MKTTPDYIHQLMTEKLAAVISAADEHYLDELIDNDPEVRKKWETPLHERMPEGTEEVLDRVSLWPRNIALLIAGRRPDNHHGKDKLIRLPRHTEPAAAIALLVPAGWIPVKGPRRV